MQFNLKPVRLAKCMTQEELSQKSGVARQIIVDLESGKDDVNTTTGTLLKLANALGVSVADIIYL